MISPNQMQLQQKACRLLRATLLCAWPSPISPIGHRPGWTTSSSHRNYDGGWTSRSTVRASRMHLNPYSRLFSRLLSPQLVSLSLNLPSGRVSGLHSHLSRIPSQGGRQ